VGKLNFLALFGYVNLIERVRIGLTGGIGCGKSTVVQLLKQRGWACQEADAIVRELLSTDAGVRKGIADKFGTSVLDANGQIDRQQLAAHVFSDLEALRWLETLLHPKVSETWRSALDAAPGRRWVVEIPLLFEKDLGGFFDANICVESTPAIVNERMKARGFEASEVEARAARQLPLATKIERADFVISNSGKLEYLTAQVDLLEARLFGKVPQ